MSTILRCSLGDCAVLKGSLVLPLRGNWVAGGLELRAPEGVEPVALEERSAATLVFTREDGTEDTFVGVVRRSGLKEGDARITATVVGGAGALLDEIPPRHHAKGATEIPAGLIARSLCDEAGETLADDVEDDLDEHTVPAWTRFEAPAGEALDLLADVLGLGWRVQADGKVWLGAETWETIEAEKRLTPDPDDGAETWACDGAPILPGRTLEGRRVIEVLYRLDAGRSRATVRAAVSGDPPRSSSRDLYRQIYAARVVSQDATTHELELVPDDARLGDTDRPLRGIRLRVGVPGAWVAVPAGARVCVAFESADPRKPFVFCFDQDTAALATKRFALIDDVVGIGTLSGTVVVTGVPTPVTFTFTPVGALGVVSQTVSLSGYIDSPGHKYVKGDPL